MALLQGKLFVRFSGSWPVNLYQRFGVYAILGCVTLLNLLVLPAMVGVLTDDTILTEAQSGWAASVNFLAASMVALFMALRMHRLHLRQVAIAGLLLAAASDITSAYAADSLYPFLASRFMAGMGAGAAYTAVMAAFARLPEVDRGYGVFVTLQFIVSGLGLYVLPVYSADLGFDGMFFAFAALEIAAVVLCFSLPGNSQSTESEGTRLPRRTELQVLLAASTLLGVLGFAVFETANVAQFTYVERLGVALDLSDHQVGLALGIGSLAGIPGAFAIVLMGRRFGRIKPLSVGIALAITGLILLIRTDAFALYLAGSCLLGFSWAFCLPYIQGLLAVLDSRGSAVAAGAATSTVGGAIGPGLAALVVGDGLYDRVFIMTIALFIAAWLSLWFANRSACGQTEGTS
jgi:predicted MFS family arabinose efflux permease